MLLRTETYGDALASSGAPVSVCHPTSHAALAFVESRPEVTVLPVRGFATGHEEFAGFAATGTM